MGFYWKQSPYALRQAILAAIHRVIPQMDGFAIANCVWALGKVGVSWGGDLAVETKRLLCLRLDQVSPLSMHGLASSLSGLSKMGADWTDIPPGTRDALLSGIGPTSFARDREGEMSLSSILFNLGQMSVTVESISPEVTQSLLFNYVAVAPAFTPQGFSSSLHGLARLGFHITMSFDTNMEVELGSTYRGTELAPDGTADWWDITQREVKRLFPLMNEMQLANSLWGLGTIGGNILEIDSPQERKRSGFYYSSRMDGRRLLAVPVVEAITSSIQRCYGAGAVATEKGLTQTLAGLAKVCMVIYVRIVMYPLYVGVKNIVIGIFNSI